MKSAEEWCVKLGGKLIKTGIFGKEVSDVVAHVASRFTTKAWSEVVFVKVQSDTSNRKDEGPTSDLTHTVQCAWVSEGHVPSHPVFHSQLRLLVIGLVGKPPVGG